MAMRQLLTNCSLGRPGPSRLPAQVLYSRSPRSIPPPSIPRRAIFNLFKTKSKKPQFQPQPDPEPLLSQDDLFHPLSESPFADLRERAERIKKYSICPVSLEKYQERVRVAYDCPDCGWPTHKDRERWEEGLEEHREVCDRLRIKNEDEHDLRSGRRHPEYDSLPGESTLCAVR